MVMTQKYLHECLDYDLDSGEFMWLERPRRHFKNKQAWSSFNTRFARKLTGTTLIKGYPYVRIDGKMYALHRLAFLYVWGWMPKEVDHVNQLRGDNSWDNLRPVTRLENTKNARLPKNNRSGYIGVSKMTGRNKWRAQIGVNGKTLNLGHFDDIKDAIRARKIAEGHFGFHGNHGNI